MNPVSIERHFFGLGMSVVVILLSITCPGDTRAEETKETSALDLFEQRIMPIFRSTDPSSCIQCHLSSVDIKDYILPSHRDTFVALREAGLVDVETPDQSKILTLIRMGDKDADAMAKRIHEKTRRAEYEAFAAWITASCADAELVAMTAPEKLDAVGPDLPLELVRHSRKNRVLESFTRNIWSQRMRCFPCHTPHEIDANNPQHGTPGQRQEDYVKTYGTRMNLFQKTPAATLSALVASSRKQDGDHYPLINLKDPGKSLLLLKPTAKLPPKQADGTLAKPSSFDVVTHMGGIKMHVDDHSYKMFVAWLNDYAAVVGGHYKTVEELPADNWIATDRILRIKGTPESWAPGSIVQMFVHPKDASSGEWSSQPTAFTQAIVTPRGMVNGALLLIASETQALASADSESFPLPQGEYLIKTYLDQNGKIAKSPTELLQGDDFVGQTVINAHWKIGFPNAETFEGSLLSK